MKRVKRVLALLAALALVLAMAVPAWAANGGNIKITNTQADTTYTIYKMFDLSYNADNDAYVYTVVSAWKSFFENGEGKNYVTLKNDVVSKGTTLTEVNAAEFAKKALTYANSNKDTITSAGSKTTTAKDEVVEFDGLELGYYLIDSSMGTVVVLDNNHETVSIKEKNEVPSVDKKIKEGSELFSENSEQIGKTVTFQTVIHAKQGAEKYVLHDTMNKGLTFSGSVVVTMGAENSTVDASKYTLKQGANVTDGCTFEVVFNPAFCDSITEAKDITVTYTATVNKNAVKVDEGKNATHLTYGEKNTTETSQTETKTYQFDLVKYTKKGDANVLLNGAEFKLYESNATDAAAIKFVYDKNTETYRVADATETTGTTDTITVNGVAKISGLKKKTYYLEEKKAPDGFNALEGKQPVDLTATNFVADATYDSEKKSYTSGGFGVENNAGTTLPSTGGMGTTVFYVVGGGLMAVAVVLLVTKKRMENKR